MYSMFVRRECLRELFYISYSVGRCCSWCFLSLKDLVSSSENCVRHIGEVCPPWRREPAYVEDPPIPNPGLWVYRGKKVHTRNQHLRSHRGFSVACSKGLPVAFSNIISLVPKACHCPSGIRWKIPMVCQWYFQMEFHFCELWCVIVCPEFTAWARVRGQDKQGFRKSATNATRVATSTRHLATKIDYRKLSRHFGDDPVCPQTYHIHLYTYVYIYIYI